MNYFFVRKTLTICYFAVIFPFAFSQQVPYTQFNNLNGLTSEVIYEVFQDSRNVIWALSESGVFRFNGDSFALINADESLRDTEPLDIVEGVNGDIIILYMDGQIANFIQSKGEIKVHSFNSLIQSKISKAINAVRILNNSLKVTKNGTIVFSIYRFGYVLINNIGVDLINNEQSKFIEIIDYEGVKILSQPQNYILNNNLEIVISGKKSKISIESSKIAGGSNIFLYHYNEYDFLALGKLLIKIKAYEIINFRLFDRNIIGLTGLNNSSLLVFKRGKKPEVISPIDLDTKNEINLPFSSICGAIKDNENGIWYATLMNGVIYVPSMDLIYYKTPNNSKTTTLYEFDDKIYFGSHGGTIGYIKNDSLLILKTRADYSEIISFFEMENKLYFITPTKCYKVDGFKLETDFGIIGYRIKMNDSFVREDTLFFVGDHGLSFYTNKNIYHNSIKISSKLSSNEKKQVLKKFKLKNVHSTKSSYLVSNGNYLFEINLNNIITDTVLESPEPIQLLSANTFGEIFYTTKNGLYCYSTLNHTKKLIFPLESKRQISLLISENNIELITAEGIYTLKNSSSPHHFRANTELNGFMITSSLSSDETTFLGINGGILSFKNEPTDQSRIIPNVILESVSVDGESMNNQPTFSSSKNITFIINILGFKNKKKSKIYYRIKKKSEWILTNQKEFNFSSLEPGNYNFQVKICLSDYCSKKIDFDFVVNPTFIQNRQYQLIIFFIIIMLTILFSYRKINSIKLKRDIQNKIFQLEIESKELHQKALRAQINPHFISNAMDSIQSFILDNNIKDSEKYLSKFSLLMRLILESSINEYIDIEEEIKLLDSFITLERLRCNFSFEYQFNVDANLRGEGLKIPSMILQPILENAVTHGVIRNNATKINVSLKDEGTIILCEIEDNGIEKGAVSENDFTKQKISRSSSIIASRIQNYKSNDAKCSFEHIKLDDKINRAGTKIIIRLPIK